MYRYRYYQSLVRSIKNQIKSKYHFKLIIIIIITVILPADLILLRVDFKLRYKWEKTTDRNTDCRTTNHSKHSHLLVSVFPRRDGQAELTWVAISYWDKVLELGVKPQAMSSIHRGMARLSWPGWLFHSEMKFWNWKLHFKTQSPILVSTCVGRE